MTSDRERRRRLKGQLGLRKEKEEKEVKGELGMRKEKEEKGVKRGNWV